MTWMSLQNWIVVGLRWLEQHPPGAVLLLGVCVGVAYWYSTLRPYRIATRAEAERLLVVKPDLFGPLTAPGTPYPARRLLDRIEPAPFGQWLTAHLIRRGLTVTQLARQLGRPVAELHAAMYGTPVGAHLPSVELVDLLCDTLELDRMEARENFYRSLPDLGITGRADRESAETPPIQRSSGGRTD